MSPLQFERIFHQAKMSNPSWFTEMEPPVRNEAILRVEGNLRRALPEEYSYFVRTFGAGYVGFLNISSMNPNSDWYVLGRPRIEINEELFLIVSDDQAGGFYGFPTKGGCFLSEVFYIYPDEENPAEGTGLSFFEFVVKLALDPR